MNVSVRNIVTTFVSMWIGTILAAIVFRDVWATSAICFVYSATILWLLWIKRT